MTNQSLLANWLKPVKYNSTTLVMELIRDLEIIIVNYDYFELAKVNYYLKETSFLNKDILSHLKDSSTSFYSREIILAGMNIIYDEGCNPTACLLHAAKCGALKAVEYYSGIADISKYILENGDYRLILNKEQLFAVEEILSGKNTFLTGIAGSGKSRVIHVLKGLFKLNKTKVGITSSTGISAIGIDGQTIHSWAGIGTGERSLIRTVEKIKKSSAFQNWKCSSVLIIDEISMISGKVFELLDHTGRLIRECDAPFGGLQLILVGDFCQLPYVNKSGPRRFPFETPSWSSIESVIYLKESMRQSDPVFLKILNQIRLGGISKTSFNTLLECKRELTNSFGIKPTKMFATNVQVNELNKTELMLLPGNGVTFVAYFTFYPFGMTLAHKEKLGEIVKKSTVIPSILELKVGAQVMLLKNLNLAEKLANGSRGVLESINEESVSVRFKNGALVSICSHETIFEMDNNITVKMYQIPLKLAYASTIHSLQGMTLDYVTTDLSNCFEVGQVYTALSRVRDRESLHLVDFNPHTIKADRKVIQFYKNIS